MKRTKTILQQTINEMFLEITDTALKLNAVIANYAEKISTAPIPGETGKIIGIVGSADDPSNMTHLKRQLEEALLETANVESAMAAMFDTNPHPNIMFDNKFNLIDCNPAAVEFMGFKTREELFLGFHEHMNKFMHAAINNRKVQKTTFERLDYVLKNGFNRFDSKIVRYGVPLELDIWLHRIPYKENFAIVCHIFDMTEANRQTKALKDVSEKNKFQLAKLKLATKAAKIGLWEMEILTAGSVTQENIFIYSNEYRQMLGYIGELDFYSSLSDWIGRVHPEDQARVMAELENHLADFSGQTPYEVEYRLLKKDGTYGYFNDAAETVRDVDGKPIRVVGAIMDVTGTKKLLLDTKRQKTAAEAANKAKSDFLSTISHEIRTPINAILGITEIQLMDETLDRNLKDALEKIYVSGDMLLRIINDLLDLSKIEAGKQELMIVNYEIASLLSDTAQTNMMRIGSKPVVFELDVDENIPAVLTGDVLRVKQILNNVLSNAFKYTEIGTVKLAVSTDSKSADLQSSTVTLVFKISDTGPGMTKEEINALFDEYSRFNHKTNRATEGTGLGMSITRKLINIMKGEIFVESELGKSTVITVRLPQGKTGSAALGREMVENLRRFRISSKTRQKMTQITREPMPYGSVLIVDDVETNIYVAKGLLAPYSLSIDSANCGFEAIEKIKNSKTYDIVFMDHMMPKMDGIETTKRIRKMGYKFPIVAMTANAVAGQVEVFLTNGFDDFVSKPIDVRQLDAVLNKFIRGKQAPEVIKSTRQQTCKAGKEEELQERPAKAGVDSEIMEYFLRDAGKSMTVLKAITEREIYGENDKLLYVTYIHGIKSSLANIGQMELSAIALKLEMSARAGDLELISSKTGAFLDSLKILVDEMTPQEEAKDSEITDEDLLFLHKKLLVIKTACEEYDEVTADNIIAKLREKRWPGPVKNLLSSTAGHLLRGYYEEAADIIDEFVRAT